MVIISSNSHEVITHIRGEFIVYLQFYTLRLISIVCVWHQRFTKPKLATEI